MNKKGFTLVELLAVIIIISLLSLITSTAVTKLVKESKEDLYETQINLIKSAAQTWGADNLTKVPDTGKCGYLTLLDLKEYGLIDSSVIDPNTSQEISDDIKIKVSTTTSSYGNVVTNYEVNPESIDGCTKIYDMICTPAIDEASTHQPPYTDYNIGNAYDCEVKPGVNNRFYILSTEGNKVNLIMNNNICEDGTISTESNVCYAPWILKEDYDSANIDETECESDVCNDEGPITAINYLNQATSSWINIENLNEIYDDANGKYTDFKLNGKARIPTKSEIIGAGYTTSTPNWLIGSYWLFTTNETYFNYAYFMNENSLNDSGRLLDNLNSLGVRPVITVSKYRIQNEILEES